LLQELPCFPVFWELQFSVSVNVKCVERVFDGLVHLRFFSVLLFSFDLEDKFLSHVGEFGFHLFLHHSTSSDSLLESLVGFFRIEQVHLCLLLRLFKFGLVGAEDVIEAFKFSVHSLEEDS